MDKNPPAKAGDTDGLNSWSGKIPHAAEQLSPCCCNYWGHALEPMSSNYWAHVPQLLKPECLEPVYHNYWAHVLQLLKPVLYKRNRGNEKLEYHKEE